MFLWFVTQAHPEISGFDTGELKIAIIFFVTYASPIFRWKSEPLRVYCRSTQLLTTLMSTSLLRDPTRGRKSSICLPRKDKQQLLRGPAIIIDQSDP